MEQKKLEVLFNDKISAISIDGIPVSLDDIRNSADRDKFLKVLAQVSEVTSSMISGVLTGATKITTVSGVMGTA